MISRIICPICKREHLLRFSLYVAEDEKDTELLNPSSREKNTVVVRALCTTTGELYFIEVNIKALRGEPK